MKINTRTMVTLAMLAAVSIILVYFVHFPIFPIAPFLEYDPADIPIIVGTFMFGPVAGLILTVISAVVQGLTVSQGSGVIGVIMHIFATGTLVLVAGNIYRRGKGGILRAVLALVCGVAAWTLSMVLWNLILTPIFMGAPRSAVIELMLPAIIPFNLIKGGVNAVLGFLVFRGIRAVLKR